MATPATPSWLLPVGSYIRGAGQLINSFQQSLDYQAQARARVRSANEALRVGKEQAAVIAKQGRAFLGQTVASYAASGVSVSSGGSVGATETEIQRTVEHDVLNTIFESQWQALALKQEASQLRRNARLSKITGALNAYATVLGG